jgi:hypothetical protein
VTPDVGQSRHFLENEGMEEGPLVLPMWAVAGSLQAPLWQEKLWQGEPAVHMAWLCICASLRVQGPVFFMVMHVYDCPNSSRFLVSQQLHV